MIHVLNQELTNTVMSPNKESASETVETSSPSSISPSPDVVNTREYGKLDLRAIKVNWKIECSDYRDFCLSDC